MRAPNLREFRGRRKSAVGILRTLRLDPLAALVIPVLLRTLNVQLNHHVWAQAIRNLLQDGTLQVAQLGSPAGGITRHVDNLLFDVERLRMRSNALADEVFPIAHDLSLIHI